MGKLINDDILRGVSGSASFNAEIRIDPVNSIRLRPNIIYDLVYDQSVLYLRSTASVSTIGEKISSGILLHQQLSRISESCIGIEMNNDAVNYLHMHGISNVIVADLAQPGITEITDNQWDFLLIAEMLEYVDNPMQFLHDISQHYRSFIRQIIIAVPNAFGLSRINNALVYGVESANTSNKYWFTPYTICKVAHQAGLSLENLFMCIHEDSANTINHNNQSELLEKPILMDTIILVVTL